MLDRSTASARALAVIPSTALASPRRSTTRVAFGSVPGALAAAATVPRLRVREDILCDPNLGLLPLYFVELYCLANLQFAGRCCRSPSRVAAARISEGQSEPVIGFFNK
jgi:hypothetical protein